METNSFTYVRPWIEKILLSIRKDIKTDHLAVDKSFFKTHFGSRPMNKLTQEEIFAVYEKELLAGNAELREWVINRWVFKHGDIYRFFADRLSAINPNFQEIQTIEDAQAEKIISPAIDSFGATSTYLFSRLNGVVFSPQIFERLNQAAMKETEKNKVSDEQKSLDESIDQMKARHQRELSRLQEKYEDKLAGVQRKYSTDVEALKKQIRSLQQRVR
ncbi:MAG: hypothetical protein HW387_1518 [Parachlamydiales bacterium]|nr:hypothetical protein [Parachlamydiales bacterium]